MLVTINYCSKNVLCLWPPLPSDPADIDLIMNAITDWRELMLGQVNCWVDVSLAITTPFWSHSILVAGVSLKQLAEALAPIFN